MHEPFLLAALDQARLGRGMCAPNPSVGAVAVHEEKIIAQSWHRGAGTPHAEQLLLEQLPEQCANITLYVTLEPCNHWGKTPPCVDAIIKRGFKKVVYAYRDPNPIIINNNTPRLLSEHGIDVLYFPLPAIDAFYESYRYWTLTHKPWVTVKMAQTMDGKIAGAAGERVTISNAICADFTHNQRLHSDVILTTARTVNQDNPLLNVRLSEDVVAKPVAIIDSHLKLNPEATILASAKHCHIYYDASHPLEMAHQNSTCLTTNPFPTSRDLSAGSRNIYASLDTADKPRDVGGVGMGESLRTCYAMPARDGRLDLEAVICHLGELGYHDVWVEAGAALFHSLHLARLVNRTYLYIAPTVLGDEAVSGYHDATYFNQAPQVTWQIMGDNVMATFDWELK